MVAKATAKSGDADRDASRDASRVTQVTFVIPVSLQNRALAIAMVAAIVDRLATADSDFMNAVTTAFGEAFNNLAIHGYRGRNDGMLEVDAEIGASHLTLHLKDTGSPVDFSDVTPPDLDSMPEGGLGVFMMHALVEEVAYRAGTTGLPNVLTLTKRTIPPEPL